MEIRNDGARKALFEYCQDGLALLREAVKQGEELPRTQRQTFKFCGSGGTGEVVEVVDWALLAGIHATAMKALPSHVAALQVVQADKRLAGRNVWEEHPERTVGSLFTRLLRKQDSLAFDPQAFDLMYSETEDYFYRDTVRYRYVAPLKRFQMEDDKIQLDSTLSLVRIPEAWSQQMLAEAEEFPRVWDPYFKAASARYGLVRYLELQKEAGTDPYRVPTGEEARPIVSKSFSEGCSALRLFKAGAVGYEYIVPRPTGWAPLSTRMLYGGGPRGHLGEGYVLSQQDAKDFVGFWNLYREAASVGMRKLDLAVRRFNMGYERAASEDRLVDYMIGFESLLLTGGDRELGYRLSLRAAALLGETPDERAAIQSNVKKAYDVRSDIVHGRKLKLPVKLQEKDGSLEKWVERDATLDEFVASVEDHLRSVVRGLRARLEEKSKGEVITDVDNRVARGFETEHGG